MQYILTPLFGLITLTVWYPCFLFEWLSGLRISQKQRHRFLFGWQCRIYFMFQEGQLFLKAPYDLQQQMSLCYFEHDVSFFCLVRPWPNRTASLCGLRLDVMRPVISTSRPACSPLCVHEPAVLSDAAGEMLLIASLISFIDPSIQRIGSVFVAIASLFAVIHDGLLRPFNMFDSI